MDVRTVVQVESHSGEDVPSVRKKFRQKVPPGNATPEHPEHVPRSTPPGHEQLPWPLP